MEKLSDFNYNGLSLEVLDIEPSYLYVNQTQIVIRITNNNVTPYLIYLGKYNGVTRYISHEKGIVQLSYVTPDVVSDLPGYELPPLSFLDVKISFENNTPQTFNERDRLELELSPSLRITLGYHENEWYVLDIFNEETLYDYLESIVERFEILEENLGVSLQNISFKIEDNYGLSIFCELISTQGKAPNRNLYLKGVLYNKKNRIIGEDSCSIYTEDFNRIKLISLGRIGILIPLKEIGKIRIYPEIM